MKKIILSLIILTSLQGIQAQSLDEKGFYISADGSLYNGIVAQAKNGVRSEIEVKNGVVNGTAAYFYASGKIMEKGQFTKGEKDQQWTRFDEAGNISAIAFYTLGKKSDTWIVFDAKGQKRMEMQYADGQKTGIWKSYDENGAVIETKDFSKVN